MKINKSRLVSIGSQDWFQLEVKIEYASVVWITSCKLCEQQLEIIQNKFLRYLYYTKFHEKYTYNRPTNELRALFLVPKLQTRRKLADSVFLFKILNGLIDNKHFKKSLKLIVPYMDLRHINKLFQVPRARTQHRQQSYFVRVFMHANESVILSIFLISELRPLSKPVSDS